MGWFSFQLTNPKAAAKNTSEKKLPTGEGWKEYEEFQDRKEHRLQPVQERTIEVEDSVSEEAVTQTPTQRTTATERTVQPLPKSFEGQEDISDQTFANMYRMNIEKAIQKAEEQSALTFKKPKRLSAVADLER